MLNFFNLMSRTDLFKKSAEYISSKYNEKADAALVAGSGYCDSLPDYQELLRISYSEIPDFPVSSVEGHSGDLMIVKIGGKKILIFSGRFHIYEGYEIPQIISPVLICKHLNISNMIFTNAAGGLNPLYKTGDIMMITRTINFQNRGIVTGIERKKFNSDIWLEEAERRAIEHSINIHKGCYCGVTGPNYETKAEIGMFRKLGADAIGMSTVLEIAAAEASGISSLGISLITNVLSNTVTRKLSHKEVLQAGEKSRQNIKKIILSAIETIPVN
jgi:purine-nucleoside phosphorylase